MKTLKFILTMRALTGNPNGHIVARSLELVINRAYGKTQDDCALADQIKVLFVPKEEKS